MSQPPAPQNDNSGFVGGCLLAVGILIVAVCGLCTLVFVGVTVVSPSARIDAVAGVLVMSLMVAGIPAAAGGVLIWAGLRILRARKQTNAKAAAKTFE